MSTMPPDDPNAEMAIFHQQVGASEASTPDADTTPAAQPAASSPSWRDEIVDDPDLPPSMRGIKVGDYIHRTTRLAAEVNQAGYQKNAAEARAAVAEATLRTIQDQMQRQPAPTRQPTPPESFGLRDPNDIYNEGVLPQVVGRIPDYVREQVAQGIQEIREQEIAPLRQQQVAHRMEQAQVAAIEQSGLNKETFYAVRPSLASIIHSNDMNPESPQSWLYALDVHRQTAARLLPQQVAVQPGAPPAGQSRPGASAIPGAKKAASTGNRHIDAEVRRQVEIWAKQGVKVSADEIMTNMRQDRSAGMGDE